MSTFKPTIRIDGQGIETLGLDNNIVGFEFRQDEFKSDVVVVDIWNKQKRFTDTSIFRERAEMDIFIGFSTLGSYAGRFILQQPKFIFPEHGVPVIRLVGFDESIRLKEAGQERRKFSNSTDSQIVTLIAAEYAFLTDIEATTEIRTSEVQINETDLHFVTKLAKRNGFMFYIENNTLHFHQVRFEDKDIELRYGSEAGDANLMHFEPEKTHIDSAHIVISSFLDKDTGLTQNLTSIDIPDAIQLQDLKRSPLHRDASQVLLQRPTKYKTDVDNNDLIKSQQNRINRIRQTKSYIIAGWGKAIGDPKIRARKVVTVKGIGHLAGLYYLRSVVHRFMEGTGYITEFFGARTRYGLLRRTPNTSVGQAGIVNRNVPGQEVKPEILAEVEL